MQNESKHRSILRRIAHRVMIEKGLLPDFPPEVIAELDKIKEAPNPINTSIKDLRNLLWCSIDNDDSRDLDQLTVASALADGTVKIYVAIADVDELVPKNSALDEHAKHNTVSVYTAAEIFPMLPEKLSTDLTSLKLESDRRANVIEMIVDSDGNIKSSDIYSATVRNHAKLAYNSVARWLEGNGAEPEAITSVKGLSENIRLQNQIAQKMKALRVVHGALGLETIEARPVFLGDEIKSLEEEKSNVAKDIIQDFMIATNGVTARFLAAKKIPSIRRIVRTPKRWDRIVELAAQKKFQLPKEPDSKALDQFLVSEKNADPVRFPDLSLSIIKLLGPGEYVVELPGEDTSGHFGLAVKDYTHATAPNRRYPDLITQRLLKAVIRGTLIPYSAEELEVIAKHCTEEEDAAKKVERQVEKSAAAMLLESRLGDRFDAIVTGVSEKGTWVRLLNPPVEGRLMHGTEGMDVGERLRVELTHTDVERGFIDFKRV